MHNGQTKDTFLNLSDQRFLLDMEVMNHDGDVRTLGPAVRYQSRPGRAEAMFRVDDVSCDSALAVNSMRTGARTLAKRSAVVRLARRSDHRDLGRVLLPIRAGASTLTAQGRAVHLGATADLRRVRCATIVGGLLPSPYRA
jgi:hypothetical protein